MAYRRTERVVRRLAARRNAILAAAEAAAAEGGMGAVQIVPVAERAGIAAGTVYRYFPSKTTLVGELVQSVTAREVGAMQQAAAAAPGPLSAIAAAIAVFAAHALTTRNLSCALLCEPVDGEADAVRYGMRTAIIGELDRLMRSAGAAGLLPPDQDPGLLAPAVAGAIVEGLVGPLAPEIVEPARQREAVQSLTLLVLRALGVADARARGLVVQTVVPLGA